jgi:hypothetical protein
MTRRLPPDVPRSKGGRPRATTNARAVQVAVRLSPEEAAQLRARAGAAGLSLSDLLRGLLFPRA